MGKAAASTSPDFLKMPSAEDMRAFAEEYASLIKEYGRFLPELEGALPKSRLVEIPKFKKACTHVLAGGLPGRLFAKMDAELPISGSVKLRGAVFEVLSHAKALEKEGVSSQDARGGYTVTTASTGNLGLSVGLVARKLGFKVLIYVSHEAFPWKVELLKNAGAEVVTIDGDYTEAVSRCRKDSLEKGYYFVDDERSELLFKGYACAAFEIAESEELKQVAEEQKKEGLTKELKDAGYGGDFPIFVYIPCGIGGAGGGIAAGLKALLGDRVHIFFAEPLEVPSVMVGLQSGRFDEVDVYEIGYTGKTDADALACGRMSKINGEIIRQSVSGIYTVEDDKMYGYLKLLGECESVKAEPSSMVALQGIGQMYYTRAGMEYLIEKGIVGLMDASVHIAWLTGGGKLPDEEYQRFYKLGEEKEKSLCDYL